MQNLNTAGHRAVAIARADWGIPIRRAVHIALTAVAFVYVCGEIVGRCAYDLGRITREAIEERNDRLASALVTFLGLQRSATPAPAPVAAPEPARVVVQRQAPEPAAIQPPARHNSRHGLTHISDPMARAIKLVKEGRSQRLAAQLCGVSRSSLQRALKGA